MGKAQGLPLTVIVIAAISLIVLVLVVSFATGSISKLFGGTKTISEEATPDQVATFRIGCKQACFQAQQLADTPSEWSNSTYCIRLIKVENENKHCWNEPIVAECNKQTEQFGVFDSSKC